jgi:type II secretory pathway pseudopilin PulG
MSGKCKIPAISTIPCGTGVKGKRSGRGYILLEVLVAMTIFAIAGGVLIRSFLNANNATRTLRDMTKAIYLTKIMLNDLELRYNRRAEVQLGEFDGNYPYPGTSKFHWFANIEKDTQRDAYIISVRTTWDDQTSSRRRRGRWRGGDAAGGITLKTMVMTARYNEDLMLGFGGAPKIEKRGGSQNERGAKNR